MAKDVYNPHLLPLFAHFVEAVYDVCAPLISETEEIAYIIAARWPGFAAPVVESWDDQEIETIEAPTEDQRMRLLKAFTSSFANAVDILYPRPCCLQLALH